MTTDNGKLGGLEWREKMPDGTSRKLEPECNGVIVKFYLGLEGIFLGWLSKFSNFFKKAYGIAKSEPKKVMHGLKVGLALTLISIFYYSRPLSGGFGSNAMWAVLTVVVVFEYTVGQTLCKCINRVTGTFLAGCLGIGVHWIATRFSKEYEPYVVGIFVFILASSATFSRFIPTIKAKFDYGAMIFILTFSLVSVSGYRVDKILELAQERLSTIAIGTSICIIISLVLCPVFAGSELHLLIHSNMDKLADSLDGYVEDYFNENLDKEENKKKLQGYKCVLNSKATEDSMGLKLRITQANVARWEPAHGPFNFSHPWKQYLEIGTQMRSCACCIESLNNCINSEIQAPEILKKSFSDICTRLSSCCYEVLKESAVTIKTMTKSSTIDFAIGEMNFALQELQDTIKSVPHEILPETIKTDKKTNQKQPTLNLIDIIPVATTTSLLIEIAGKVEGIVDAIDELAELAHFKPATDEKSKQDQSHMDKTDELTMKVFQKSMANRLLCHIGRRVVHNIVYLASLLLLLFRKKTAILSTVQYLL